MTKERLAEIETYLETGYSSPILRELLDAFKESKARVGKLREAHNLATHYLGCGDNSCLFVKPTGMATNGGCRCVERGARPGVAPSLGRLFKAVAALLAETAPDSREGSGT